MTELPKTDGELQTLIEDAVKNATEKLAKEYDGKFAAQRTKYEGEIKSLKDSIGKSAEEIAKQKMQEQYDADQRELTELRSFRKNTLISNRLAKDNLPSYLVNDSRLLNSTDEDFEKNYKSVKADYESTLPKGNQHTTVVNTNVATPNSGDKRHDAINKMGECLKGLVG